MDTAKYITPLHINGLNGRVLHMPGPTPSAPEVLFVYGHHSSLERWQGIAQLVSRRCAITMPDLPGFGGMDSLYTIGKPATLNNLADYLADFIRQRYQNRQVIIIGMSLGFVVATRMLQRHPELIARTAKLISFFGFAHHNDFVLPPKSRRRYLAGARIFAMPMLHSLYRALMLNAFVLRRAYHHTPNAKEKFKGLATAQHKENLEFEVKLWQQDDTRTYMKTTTEFLTLDNTKHKLDMPVYHVAVAADRYFNNANVAKHFRQIFRHYILLAELPNGSHAPTRIATAQEAAQIIPASLLDALAPAPKG